MGDESELSVKIGTEGLKTRQEVTEIDGHKVGVLVLGTEDPLAKGAGCLYHGAGEQISVDPGFDYWNEGGKYDGSVTLGYGLYTTDNKVQADNYARNRGAGGGVVSEIVPFEARMLDLREGGVVPEVVFSKWTDYWQKRYGEMLKRYKGGEVDIALKYEFPEFEMIIEACLGGAGEYNHMLEDIRMKPNEDNRRIRYVLGTMTIPEYNIGQGLAPIQTAYFADFMRSLGFDGIIALEGGDDEDFLEGGAASFVFFDLNKVGTRDNWQKRLIDVAI